MSKLDSVLAKIQKDYKFELKSAKESSKIERITLDSPGMNFILGGGFALGRIYELSGPESGGKSTISTYIASQIQKKYKGHETVVYCDFEYSFNSEWAENMGLDVDDHFILLRPMSGEDGFEMIKELVDTGEVGLVIIDSSSSIASKAQLEDANKATFGGSAKVMANGLKLVNPYLYNNKCSMILIAQERANIGCIDQRTSITWKQL